VSVPRPHTAVNGTSRLRGAHSAYSRAPIFSEFLGPQIYALNTGVNVICKLVYKLVSAGVTVIVFADDAKMQSVFTGVFAGTRNIHFGILSCFQLQEPQLLSRALRAFVRTILVLEYSSVI